MPEEFTPTSGSYMDKVVKAGGIEAYKLAQAKEFMEQASKIKPNQWKGINEVLTGLKDFIGIDAGSIFGDVKNSIVDSITLKTQELLSPLKNEINAELNKILEPFIPFLEGIVNTLLPVIQWVADGIQDIMDFLGMATFTGGGYTVDSYITFLSKRGGHGSIFDYYYYLLEEMSRQKAQAQTHTYLPTKSFDEEHAGRTW